jgi:hypothetical protein
MIDWVTILLHIKEVLGLNLGFIFRSPEFKSLPREGYFDRGFLLANIRTI